MPDTALIAGATGFVGRRLLRALADEGVGVVATSRRPDLAHETLPGYEVRYLNTTEPDSMRRAMDGCHQAYYLVHSLREGGGLEEREARAAENFARAAHKAGIQRIVYLGGVEPRGVASPHLRSRLQTGAILRAGEVPAIELRASMIVGGGSESWRIVRDIAARLPFMVLPRWLDSVTEPIGIDDVVAALAHAAKIDLPHSGAFDIPGPELLSAKQIIQKTASLMGIRPRTVSVPLVTPRLSSIWIRLVTRADYRVAAALVEGLRTDLVATGASFWPLMPTHVRTSFEEAARSALQEEDASLPRNARRIERIVRGLLPSWSTTTR